MPNSSGSQDDSFDSVDCFNATDSDAPLSSPHDSVTHLFGSPWVCGILVGDGTSLVRITPEGSTCLMVNGGSNVLVTGDLWILVSVVDILPIPISVALEGAPSTFDNCITKQGLLPLTLSDGTTYYQPCYYCANMVETTISLAAVLASLDQFFYWTQVGCKDPTTPGSLQFTSRNSCLSMTFDLEYCEGLYYCKTDVFNVGHDPILVQCNRIIAPATPDVQCTPSKFTPMSKA